MTWPRLVYRTLLPVAIQAVLYAAVGIVNASRTMHDDTLLVLERAWFGTPWRDWAIQWPSPGVSLLLHGCYLAYYLVLTVPYARLSWRGEHEAWRATFRAHLVTLCVGCALYLLWPVEGPRFRAPIDATVLPDIGHRFTNWILATFSARGTAFPSSHVSLALTQLLLAWRYQRALTWWIAPVVVGIGVGAVYGGYHYLIDVIAGAVLGVMCVLTVMRWASDDRH
jgi:membrane-associated phospholipid phosphatase